jgi:hypothetical protein
MTWVWQREIVAGKLANGLAGRIALGSPLSPLITALEAAHHGELWLAYSLRLRNAKPLGAAFARMYSGDIGRLFLAPQPF